MESGASESTNPLSTIDLDMLDANREVPAGQENATSSLPRPRKRTSEVWAHFETKEVMFKGSLQFRDVCKHCKTDYKTNNEPGINSGTGHLSRHLAKCLPIHLDENDPKQAKIVLGSAGVGNWTYSQSRMREGLATKSFGLDVHNRWNSTYMMLKAIEGYETVILDALIDSDYELDMIDFENCKVFTKFLGVFYTATKKLSGVYYSTTCIALNQLYNIAVSFKQCRDNRLYGRVIMLMEEKYLKYWEAIPPLFILASVMDPRKKIIGTVLLIEGIANAFDREPLDSFASVHRMLLKLFNHYSSTHGSNVQTTVAQSQSDFGELDPSERLLSNCSTTVSSGTSNTNSISELVRYLELDVTVFLGSKELGSNFDILQFWKTHGNSFPILQIMARDLLTPPASTVASETCFSLSGRILSKKRSRLAPDILDALVCSKDWNDARKRRQEFNDEYEEIFSRFDS